MKTYTFRVIIEPDQNKTYHGFVPILRGCHTWGNSIEETKKNLQDAIKCHVQGLVLDKEPIPQEEDVFEVIQTFSEKEFSSKPQAYA